MSTGLYFQTLGGGFVYDDKPQILNNAQLRSPAVVRTVMTPVWGLQGEGNDANYWRPVFNAWLIANHRLFGLKPAGWHLSNVALHGLVVALLYGVLRRLGLEWRIAAAICLVFAVHPVQVESVAWVSGSPNMLVAAASLGSLWMLLRGGGRFGLVQAGSLVLYAVALLAKEIAILLPAVVWGAAWWFVFPALPIAVRRRRVAILVAPYAVLAGAYFLVRWAALGFFQAGWQFGPLTFVATLPAVLLFYLRQIFFPAWLALGYPIRAIPPGQAGAATFLLPMAVILAVVFVLYRLARRSRIGMLGGVLFLAALAPALNFASFRSDELVHDRYLYLPLPGILAVLLLGLAGFLQARLGKAHASWLCLAVAVAASVPLSLKTVGYTKVWLDEETLWDYNARSDPGSVVYQLQYALSLLDRARVDEAKIVLQRIRSDPADLDVLLVSAEVAIAEGRHADATADLRAYLDRHGASVAAYDRLAMCLREMGQWGQSVAVLREARSRIPDYHCYFTDKLAFLLIERGEPEQALAELEAVRERIAEEPWDASRLALFRLGQLYLEAGRLGEGYMALEDFVEECRNCALPEAREAVQQAVTVLGR